MNKKLKPKVKKVVEMKSFENAELGCSFSIPMKPNIFEQMKFQSAAASQDAGTVVLIRFWRGALELIKDWSCEKLPDPRQLDVSPGTEVTDPYFANLISWVGSVVSIHLSELGDVPKNE